MKTRKFFGFLMILASGLLFLNCTSDPIPGPPGADGQDGIDGVDGQDGQDGVAGTASCVACHNNTLRDEIAAAFDLSAHGSGTTFARGASASCAQCHGSEGYIDYVTIGVVDTTQGAYAGIPVSCNTCHSSHSTFDFENDGPDYALRKTDGSQLVLAPSITLDFGDASNNCITCHQPRPSYPIPALNPDGTYVVTSTRFGPHHSPQSTMLQGILGAEIPGNENYPAAGSAGHRSGSSCVQCHMADAEDPELGGHSWTPVDAVCTQCHPPLEEATGVRDDMETLLALLQAVEGEGYDEDEDGNIIPNGEVVIGIIRPDSEDRTNTGIFSDVAAMAAWNYKTVLEDQSNGIHNPNYTKALLKNSIQALQNEQ